MKTQAVIGGVFGDEGKGKVVSYLCSKVDPKKSIVVRFSGGNQAGHNVIVNGISHTFANFGSGTLQGVPTYWSKYCTVDPVGLLKELAELKSKGVNPIIYIDERCPIVTPYDKMSNAFNKENMSHGSCGVGFGSTLQREEDFYSLTVLDLKYPNFIKPKLDAIERYYKHSIPSSLYDEFIEACKHIFSDNVIPVPDWYTSLPVYNNYIFEGSQGLLLDQHFGFFPNVTRSNTGLENIYDMGFLVDEVYVVTRAYQTRHGNGFMTNEELRCLDKPKDNPYEINVNNPFQGEFRKSILDLDLLRYALEKDRMIYEHSELNLVITCLDVVKGNYSLTYTDEDDYRMPINFNTEKPFIDLIKKELGIDKILVGYTPDQELSMKYYKKEG